MTLQRLHDAILSAGVAIVGVSVADPANKATWLVSPTNLQSAAQATINTFDTSQAAEDAWAQQQAIKRIGFTQVLRKSADEANSTVNFANVAGLMFNLAPNTHYRFRFLGAYAAAATTTGLQLAVNGPANPVFLALIGSIATSTTASLNGAQGAYDATTLSATASGGSTALPFWIEGTISTGAVGGSFALRFRSEVANSAVTIKRGSFAEIAAVA